MSDDVDPERLGADPALPFVRTTLILAPGRALAYDPEEWRDAIVFVTAGQVALECENGMVERFGRGCILCLAELPLRAVRSTGATPARLVSISRRVR